MNTNLPEDHASIQYYDSDYPSEEHSVFSKNFDDIVSSQGLKHDVDRFLDFASKSNEDILELCCGSGRVTIPLAKAGHRVTGVDNSRGILEQFEHNLQRENEDVRQNIKLIEQDITLLNLDKTDYKLVICAFNSLMCIPDFDSQCKALSSIYNHMSKDGLIVIDLMNPFILNLSGDAIPKPFFTRKNSHTGNSYTRFAASGPMNKNQVQELYGWYDEVLPDGTLKRKNYSMKWRIIFPFEIKLMLKQVGFNIKTIEGGHQKEPYTTDAKKMFIVAEK
ncbi:class I SAM-dependent methyltransferase [Aquimarina megaterium]|uniref:class I SAM-dependent methyltransferase n=1 Tax=Aquimarina megaterium TaxID=1443666 RepID=UPI0004B11B7C|nr:class I SAM-dependent methyltransferase [Aquimarina megaterium]